MKFILFFFNISKLLQNVYKHAATVSLDLFSTNTLMLWLDDVEMIVNSLTQQEAATSQTPLTDGKRFRFSADLKEKSPLI